MWRYDQANTAIIIIMNKIIAPITTLLLRRHFLSIIAAELLFNVSKPVTTLIFDSRIDRAVCQVHDQVYYQEHCRKQQDAGLYNRIIIAQDRLEYLQDPAMKKIFSMTTDPLSMYPVCVPITVISGRAAFFSACLMIIALYFKPLAFAVLV